MRKSTQILVFLAVLAALLFLSSCTMSPREKVEFDNGFRAFFGAPPQPLPEEEARKPLPKVKPEMTDAEVAEHKKLWIKEKSKYIICIKKAAKTKKPCEPERCVDTFNTNLWPSDPVQSAFLNPLQRCELKEALRKKFRKCIRSALRLKSEEDRMVAIAECNEWNPTEPRR